MSENLDEKKTAESAKPVEKKSEVVKPSESDTKGRKGSFMRRQIPPIIVLVLGIICYALSYLIGGFIGGLVAMFAFLLFFSALITLIFSLLKSKKSKLIGVIVAVVLIVVIAAYVIVGLGIYKKRWDKDMEGNQSLSWVLNLYPAMWVNSTVISMDDYWLHVRAMKHFFGEQMQVEFDSAEGQEMMTEIENQVEEKLKTEALISQLVKSEGVEVNDSDVEEEFQNYVTQLGGSEEDAIKSFEQQFGWGTKEEVKKYAIYPYVERVKLLEKLMESDDYKTPAKEKAEEVLAKVKEKPESFSDLAKEYSDDLQSAELGGELGFFGEGMMVPAFEEAAFALDTGQISEVVETDFGYHIITVNEKKEDEENGEQVKAAHILLGYFESWLQEKEDEANISIWI